MKICFFWIGQAPLRGPKIQKQNPGSGKPRSAAQKMKKTVFSWIKQAPLRGLKIQKKQLFSQPLPKPNKTKEKKKEVKRSYHILFYL